VPKETAPLAALFLFDHENVKDFLERNKSKQIPHVFSGMKPA
jgi:hypothetical protein